MERKSPKKDFLQWLLIPLGKTFAAKNVAYEAFLHVGEVPPLLVVE